MFLVNGKTSRCTALIVTIIMIMSMSCFPIQAAGETDYALTVTNPDLLYQYVYADVENSSYTHTEFIQTLKDAGNQNAFLTVFDDATVASSTTVLNVLNGSKKVAITKDMSSISGSEYFESKKNTWGYWYVLGSEPMRGESLANWGRADIPFTYKFSKVQNGSKNEYVTSLGMEIVATSGSGDLNDETIEVTATYANLLNETKQVVTLTSDIDYIYETKEAHNMFYGFKAPENYYIQSIVVTDKDTGTWPTINDMCFITSQVQGPDPIVKDIEISGEQIIISPTYHTTDTYIYSAKVLDQFGEEMPEEEVTISLTAPSDNPSVSFENGVLTIKQGKDVPSEIILTAISDTDPTVMKEHVITLQGEGAYYNETLIGVPDGNPDYVLSEFKEDLAAATASEDKDMAIFNFVSEDLTISSGEMYIPLDRTQKPFGVKRVGSNIVSMQVVDGIFGGMSITPSAGDYFSLLQPIASGKNTYSFVTDNLGDMRVSKLGLVILSYNSMKVEAGFGITATFSDGTTRIYGKDLTGGGNPANNIFFGIEAPEGHYITLLDIATVPKVWGGFDELGVILEKPDTLTLDIAYENLLFSTVTDQDMKNIRNNLNLYTSTPEGATIDWDSDNEAVINPDTGAVTFPDTSENSNVKLTAKVTYGVLTKPRSFNLYVPSKLDLDANALVLPERVSENISLPLVGGVQGSAISWVSDNPNLIKISDSSDTGIVQRPDGRDGYVILTATISNSSGSITKTFPINVSGTIRDETLGESSSSGSGGGGGGGRGSIPAVSVPAATPPEVLQQKTSFTDVDTSHWAYSSIMKLYEKGIVNGVGDGKFNPEGTVTREQFVSMLVRAMEFKLTDTNLTFSDVEKGGWYEDAVRIAAGLNIVSGRNDGSFGVGHNITREDMAVMVYRAMTAAGKELSEGEAVKWDDEEMISDYAMQAISFLRQNGIINGVTETSFSPKTTTTRAQAAAIICRITEGV